MDKGIILVVDDDAFFRHQYGDILTGAGYHTLTAASAEEALDILADEAIDVMLTDLVLPGMSGLDLLREVKRREGAPEVILVTGHATIETAINALKAGARDYLVKPFDSEVLLHDVHTCLEQRRLLNENIHLKRQIRLFTSGQELAAIIDMEHLLTRAISAMLHETGSGRAFSFLSNNRNELDIVATHNVNEDLAQAIAKQLSLREFNCTGIQTLEGVDVTGLAEASVDLRRVMVFPLCNDDKEQGAMVLFNPSGGDFEGELYEPNIRFLFEQLTLGFANAMRYEGARDLMFTDDLTGLYNYRFLQSSLAQEVRRCERYGAKFSVVFIDLDHFKEINDTYGHLVGSSALAKIGELLRTCVREVDLLFRYGGDEFSALLLDTDKVGARTVCERVRRTIAEHDFSHGKDVSYHLTATIGFATYPEDAKTKEELMDMADRAMYRGKTRRNVVLGAQDPALE